MSLVLRSARGAAVSGADWLGVARGADARVLDHARGPVLDVGCGPGRHARALLERGVPTLGIDVTPPVVELARARGVDVLQRSAFERVPRRGAWGTVLLLDGNVGIGGDPQVLLTRVRELVAADGRALVECVGPRVEPESHAARLEVGGRAGPWFRWCTVGIDELGPLAVASGFAVGAQWHDEGRWFARLDRVGTA
ncbi:MAG TPA: class I SAM-dependent methyltransferase [Acidimicrobiia bacterium]|nr:class I SAM-dependent methyltransferase [Acidimicrobiia bacterium]